MIAKNIGGQQVTGKLDAQKCESERARQCLRGVVLPTPGMSSIKGDRARANRRRRFYRLILAYDNFTNLLRESVNRVGHPEIICGNAALRK
jgi:hypothetical protein